MPYVGEETIGWLIREQLKVDEQWSVQLPRGFRWWADQQAQTIEVIRTEEGPAGDIGWVVSIRTELLCNVTLDEKSLRPLHMLMMQGASMAGPVYDEQQRSLSLCSLVKVHDGISQWMNPLLSVAAVLQLGEARTLGSVLAKTIGAELAISTHPRSGARPQPDEMAQLAHGLFVPMGQGPSRWGADEFVEAVDRYMQGPPALVATSGGAGFTVEFPFAGTSSLCRAVADHPHPIYGSGLLVLQSFPHRVRSDADGIRLALALNRAELRDDGPFGYGFGSYAYRGDTVHFASFFPNAMYRPGLLPSVYFASAGRAREIAARLAGKDWDTDSFEPKKSALGRFMDRLSGRSG